MPAFPPCPQCAKDNTYPDGELLVCADCGHEWLAGATAEEHEDSERRVVDANGNVLLSGDAVVLIKDLKVKGAGQTLKQGTVIRSIRLTDNPDEIDCRHDAIKGLVLRTEFVRKR